VTPRNKEKGEKKEKEKEKERGKEKKRRKNRRKDLKKKANDQQKKLRNQKGIAVFAIPFLWTR
jgi:hypothetical protein